MGRPSHEPTEENRTAVAIAAGGGMSHEEIAIGMGIDRNTLEKHYEAELSEGAYAKRREVLQALHAAALKGNASAAREYLSGRPGLAAPPADPKTPPKGKKEQANEAAKGAQAGTSWDKVLPGPTSRQ